MASENKMNLSHSDSVKSILRFIGLYIKQGSLLVVLLGIISLLLGLIPMFQLIVTSKIVDHFSAFVSFSRQELLIPIYRYLVLLSLLMVTANWLRVLAEGLQEKIRIKFEVWIQTEILQKSHQLDLTFYEHEESYNQLQRASKSFGNTMINFFEEFFVLVESVLSIIGYLLLLLAGHWLLAVIALMTLIPSLKLKIQYSQEHYKQHYNVLTSLERKGGYFEELLYKKDYAKENRLFQDKVHIIV